MYSKTRYNPNSTTKLLEDFISPSQEAFTLRREGQMPPGGVLYKNGYEIWVWIHDHTCTTLHGSDVTAKEEGGDNKGCPHHKYTKRSGNITSRNGGWTREGMTLYNELYKTVRSNRQTDDGAIQEDVHGAQGEFVREEKEKEEYQWG